MIHYLWTGHLDEEHGHVRFSRSDSGDMLRPIVRRPLDASILEAVLRRMFGDRLTVAAVTRLWGVALTAEGFIVSDEYTRCSDAVAFIAAVAEQTGAQIWADNGLRLLPKEVMEHEWAERSRRIVLAHRKGNEAISAPAAPP
jgi:hypothetical protein